MCYVTINHHKWSEKDKNGIKRLFFALPISIYLYLEYTNDSTKVKSKGTQLTEGFIHPPAGAMQSIQVGPSH